VVRDHRTRSTASARPLAAQLNLRSATAARTSIETTKMRAADVRPTFDAVYARSEKDTRTLVCGVLRARRGTAESEANAREMIRWAGAKRGSQRLAVCRGYRDQKMQLPLLYGISELSAGQARSYMKDYFKAGGDLKDVAEYLQVVGSVLRKHRVKSAGTDGVVVDAAKWVAGKVEDAVDAAIDGVTKIVDAVVKAGKSLASLIGQALNWAASKIADLVDALVEAGKSVAYILGEAVKKGTTALNLRYRAQIPTIQRTAVAQVRLRA